MNELASDRYKVSIEPAAWDFLIKLRGHEQEHVFAAIESLETNPRPSGVVNLEGVEYLYRVRAGNYRIIYGEYKVWRVVLVVKFGNRRAVSKKR